MLCLQLQLVIIGAGIGCGEGGHGAGAGEAQDTKERRVSNSLGPCARPLPSPQRPGSSVAIELSILRLLSPWCSGVPKVAAACATQCAETAASSTEGLLLRTMV